MSYLNVIPGMTRLPESADRYNAVNALLRNYGAGVTVPETPALHSGIMVDVKNTSAAEIAPFAPVKLGRPVLKENFPHIFAFEALAPDAPDSPWGIAAETIGANNWGKAVISGITPAKFAGYLDGHPSAAAPVVPGDCVSVCRDGLISCGSGNAQIIASPQWVSETQKWLPGVISIGTWFAPAAAEFNVRCVSISPLKYTVSAGRTPFPSIGRLKENEIYGVAGAPYLCLVISYARSESGYPVYSYSFEFLESYLSITGTRSDAFVFLLATCMNNGKVMVNPGIQEQIYMRGWVL